MKNFNIASTIINEDIRISSAAIFYESFFFGNYFQIETFIFSNNKDVLRSKQIIHCTVSGDERTDIDINIIDNVKKIHTYVCKNIKDKII